MSASDDWLRSATQERSRQTQAAIRRAASELLRRRPFDEIHVADVADAAGVSVGGFYRRYRDKKALLHLADEDFIDDCLAAFEREMADERMRGKTLAEMVRAYVSVMVSKFREHRESILQVIRHADPGDAATFARRARAFNERVHGRLRELLRQRAGEISHPDLEVALNLAIFFASAAARDAVWRGSLRAYPVTIDDERLIEEIARGFVAYLRS